MLLVPVPTVFLFAVEVPTVMGSRLPVTTSEAGDVVENTVPGMKAAGYPGRHVWFVGNRLGEWSRRCRRRVLREDQVQ